MERINVKGAAPGSGRRDDPSGAAPVEKLPELDSCVDLYPTAEFQSGRPTTSSDRLPRPS